MLNHSSEAPTNVSSKGIPGRKGTKGVTVNLDEVTSTHRYMSVEFSTTGDNEKFAEAESATRNEIGTCYL